jgi:hypothetical protein
MKKIVFDAEVPTGTVRCWLGFLPEWVSLYLAEYDKSNKNTFKTIFCKFCVFFVSTTTYSFEGAL